MLAKTPPKNSPVSIYHIRPSKINTHCQYQFWYFQLYLLSTTMMMTLAMIWPPFINLTGTGIGSQLKPFVPTWMKVHVVVNQISPNGSRITWKSVNTAKKVGSLVDCKADGDDAGVDGRSMYFQFVPCCSGGCDGGVVVVMMMMIDRGNGLYFHLIWSPTVPGQQAITRGCLLVGITMLALDIYNMLMMMVTVVTKTVLNHIDDDLISSILHEIIESSAF